MSLEIKIPINSNPSISVTSEWTLEQALESATKKVESLTQNAVFTCDGYTPDVNSKEGIFADLEKRVGVLNRQIALARVENFPANEILGNAYKTAIKGNEILARIYEKDSIAQYKAIDAEKWKKREAKAERRHRFRV